MLNPKYPAPPHEKQAPAVEKTLKTFDVLDFEVFSNQKWDRLQRRARADRDEDRRPTHPVVLVPGHTPGCASAG